MMEASEPTKKKSPAIANSRTSERAIRCEIMPDEICARQPS
jgi:hypothetical protein